MHYYCKKKKILRLTISKIIQYNVNRKKWLSIYILYKIVITTVDKIGTYQDNNILTSIIGIF